MASMKLKYNLSFHVHCSYKWVHTGHPWPLLINGQTVVATPGLILVGIATTGCHSIPLKLGLRCIYTILFYESISISISILVRIGPTGCHSIPLKLGLACIFYSIRCCMRGFSCYQIVSTNAHFKGVILCSVLLSISAAARYPCI